MRDMKQKLIDTVKYRTSILDDTLRERKAYKLTAEAFTYSNIQ